MSEKEQKERIGGGESGVYIRELISSDTRSEPGVDPSLVLLFVFVLLKSRVRLSPSRECHLFVS